MSGNIKISEYGKRLAASKKDETSVRVHRAMKDIELIIEKNAGIYPFSGGKVTAAEVLRRAGLRDRAILQKKRHSSLRAKVNSFALRCEKAISAGHDSVRKSVTERSDEAWKVTRQIQQRWAEAELEYTALSAELVGLRRHCAALEAEIAQLVLKIDGCGAVS